MRAESGFRNTIVLAFLGTGYSDFGTGRHGTDRHLCMGSVNYERERNLPRPRQAASGRERGPLIGFFHLFSCCLGRERRAHLQPGCYVHAQCEFGRRLYTGQALALWQSLCLTWPCRRGFTSESGNSLMARHGASSPPCRCCRPWKTELLRRDLSVPT